MVVCLYFLNNTCRYGTKCSNEHIDIGEIFKSDIDACINGNQWLFSSYGPFKDSQNFPNFIDDLSFEEVRAQYYESKSNGTLLTYTEHFKTQLNNVKTKLQQFYRMDGSTWNTLIDVYDNLPRKSPITAATTTTATPSTIVAAVPIATTQTATTNAQINNNIFGSNGFNFTNNNNNNIFGGPAVAAGTAAVNTTATIQQQQQQQPNNGGNIFGNSIFGGGGGGGTNTQQILNAPVGIFGGNNIDNNTIGQQQLQPTTNIFGNNTFGSGQIGNIQNNNNIASSNVGNTFSGGGGNVFGTNNTFTQSQNQQQTPFGGTISQNNIFGNASNTFIPNNNVFGGVGGGQVQSTPQQQPTNNIFGQVQVPAQTQQQLPFQQNNLFGNNVNPTNIFGSFQQPQQQQQQPFENDQKSTMNMFESNFDQQSSGFGVPTNQFPSTTAQPQIANNNNNNSLQQTPSELTMYSETLALTPEILESFKAETFEMGKIPEQPPPLELCR